MSKHISTGVQGLDEILQGGFIEKRSYLVHGGPGVGKSTLGLHFLNQGAVKGEKVLYITLEESVEGIKSNNQGRGFNFKKIDILDISPTSSFFSESMSYDIFSPAEVEKEPITNQIIEQIEKIKPSRVFVDTVTQFRYFNNDVFQYRKQVLSFLRYLIESGSTVLFTSESSIQAPDEDLQFLSDGVINLQNNGNGRTIEVQKMRGCSFASGQHAVKISDKGVEVFPRIVPNEQTRDFNFEIMSTGIKAFDNLLHGGIERGTITIITGPSGVGKTTIGLQMIKEAATRNEKSILYSFEEELELILTRCDMVGINAREMIRKGNLSVRKIEPTQYSADEFAWEVCREAKENDTKIVMIDSISGYRLSLRDEGLQTKIHTLTKYLQNLGVAVLIINETESITGDFRITDDRFSHIADNVIFLRYIEVNGELKKAIGVLKKRLSNFEKTMREFEINQDGIMVGEPYRGMRGILLGVPELVKE